MGDFSILLHKAQKLKAQNFSALYPLSSSFKFQAQKLHKYHVCNPRNKAVIDQSLSLKRAI
jgi:hypothetical protein